MCDEYEQTERNLYQNRYILYIIFDDIINTNNNDPKNIKEVVKLSKNILIYYTGYVTPSTLKLNFKNLYIIFNKTNGHIEEKN